MRSSLLSLVFAAFVSSGAAHAQQQPQQKGPVEAIQEWIQSLGKPPPPPKPPEPPPQNVVSLNPFALEHERLGVEYERALFSAMSLYIAPQGTYGTAGSSWALSAGGDAGIRFYILGDAPNGLYVGPAVTGIYARSFQQGVLRKGFGIGLGACAGLSLILFNRYALAVGFAAEYTTEPDLTDPTGETVVTRFTPLPRVSFGVAF